MATTKLSKTQQQRKKQLEGEIQNLTDQINDLLNGQKLGVIQASLGDVVASIISDNVHEIFGCESSLVIYDAVRNVVDGLFESIYLTNPLPKPKTTAQALTATAGK